MNFDSILGDNATLILLAALWALPWKGYALWKSARKNQPWWFVALLIINTLGILEILYIFFFSEMKGWKLGASKNHQQ